MDMRKLLLPIVNLADPLELVDRLVLERLDSGAGRGLFCGCSSLGAVPGGLSARKGSTGLGEGVVLVAVGRGVVDRVGCDSGLDKKEVLGKRDLRVS
jgi:hypothetical protein